MYDRSSFAYDQLPSRSILNYSELQFQTVEVGVGKKRERSKLVSSVSLLTSPFLVPALSPTPTPPPFGVRSSGIHFLKAISPVS